MPTLNREKIGQYISGYVDGEGCFSISIRPRKTLKAGWEVRPSFSVGQNKDRKEILELMKNYFNCGAIRANQGDNTLKFETRNIDEIISKIIPHFEKYPLLSSKFQDFEKFRNVCSLIKDDEHLKEKGILKIIEIVKNMNISGKRNYSPEIIQKSLLR